LSIHQGRVAVVIADLDDERAAELAAPAWSRHIQVSNEDTVEGLFDAMLTTAGAATRQVST
jgi:hypothetical protein